MYYTAPSSVSQSHNAGWWDGSRNYYFNDLYTYERHLVYECLKTLIYEKQRYLGMLNPFAEEYFPTTEEPTRQRNEKTPQKHSEENKQESQIRSKSCTESRGSSENDITTRTSVAIPTDQQWKEVTRKQEPGRENKRNNSNRNRDDETSVNHRNYYDLLSDEDGDYDSNEISSDEEEIDEYEFYEYSSDGDSTMREDSDDDSSKSIKPNSESINMGTDSSGNKEDERKQKTREELVIALDIMRKEKDILTKNVMDQKEKEDEITKENHRLEENIKLAKDQVNELQKENRKLIETMKSEQLKMENQTAQHKEDVLKANKMIAEAKQHLKKDSDIMEKMKSKIDALKANNTKLQLKNHTLKSEVDEEKIRNWRLTRDINNIKEVMNDDHEDEHQQKKRNITIMAELSALKTEHLDLEKEFYLLEDKYDDLMEKYNQRVSAETKEVTTNKSTSTLKKKRQASKQVRFKENTE